MSLSLPIRIVSDLHLAHPASVVKNIDQRGPVLDGAKTVIFNGDTAELRIREARVTAARYLESVKDFCARHGSEPCFITGNHDPDVSKIHAVNALDGRLVVTHGEVFFREVTPWGRESRKLGEARDEALRELTGDGEPGWPDLLEAAKLASIRCQPKVKKLLRTRREWIGGVLRETGHPLRAFHVLRAWGSLPGRVSRLMEAHCPDARWVVVGHTHLPGVWRRKGRTVLNTGAYLPWFGRSVVEITEGEIVVRRVVPQGKFFVPERELFRETFRKSST
jgi:predicted phosphodiesterase